MRIRAKKVSALFLSLMLLISGFSGFFTGNEVFGGTGVDRAAKIGRASCRERV